MTVVGLQWVQSTDTYSCPAADSIQGGGATPIPATRVAACNSIDPWMSMVRCNLWDTGVQTATGVNNNTSTAADRCYTDTDVANMGQVMVKLKKSWYATNHTGTPGSMTYRWYITNNPTDALPTGATALGESAWGVHPAFIRNGVTKDQIYIGAYEGYVNDISGTLYLESKAGVLPSGDDETTLLTGNPHGTLPNFRSWAHNRVIGAPDQWEMQDHLTVSYIQLLGSLEYGGFNWQALIGQGNCNNTARINTGSTGSAGNTSYGVPGDGIHAMSYRGIENFYANLLKWVDGLNISGSERQAWVANHGFACDTFDGTIYQNTNATLAGSGGYISDINTNSTYDYGFLPWAVAGSPTADFCDYYIAPAGNMIYNMGYGYPNTTLAGPFAWRTHSSGAYGGISSTGYNIGTRLMYIG